MMRLHEKIRSILENTPGLTQRGLAEHMGLNPAAVNRMLHGNRNIKAEEIPLIEEYLGVKISLSSSDNYFYQQKQPASARRGFSDVAQARLHPDAHAQSQIPVYGGPLPKKNIMDWVARHPAQSDLVDAFAVYVPDDAMEPRYLRGELVYLHPHRPAELQKDCLIDLHTDETMLRRLVSQTAETVSVTEFSSTQEKKIPRKNIRAIYAVIGRG